MGGWGSKAIITGALSAGTSWFGGKMKQIKQCAGTLIPANCRQRAGSGLEGRNYSSLESVLVHACKYLVQCHWCDATKLQPCCSCVNVDLGHSHSASIQGRSSKCKRVFAH